MVNQVCRPIGHATAATARTESAPFARERDQAIVMAGRAPELRKAGREAPARQEVSKLLFDKARQTLPVADAGGLSAESLEMIAHQLVYRRTALSYQQSAFSILAES
jgi:hypothetical protein